jgi:hypothetical protein
MSLVHYEITLKGSSRYYPPMLVETNIGKCIMDFVDNGIFIPILTIFNSTNKDCFEFHIDFLSFETILICDNLREPIAVILSQLLNKPITVYKLFFW